MLFITRLFFLSVKVKAIVAAPAGVLMILTGSISSLTLKACVLLVSFNAEHNGHTIIHIQDYSGTNIFMLGPRGQTHLCTCLIRLSLPDPIRSRQSSFDFVNNTVYPCVHNTCSNVHKYHDCAVCG